MLKRQKETIYSRNIFDTEEDQDDQDKLPLLDTLKEIGLKPKKIKIDFDNLPKNKQQILLEHMFKEKYDASRNIFAEPKEEQNETQHTPS